MNNTKPNTTFRDALIESYDILKSQLDNETKSLTWKMTILTIMPRYLWEATDYTNFDFIQARFEELDNAYRQLEAAKYKVKPDGH